MIEDQDLIKTYLYLTHNGELGMKNTKFNIINQQKNATCHMQSFKNDYLGTLGSFHHISTIGR
jgi:hypothetical protein